MNTKGIFFASLVLSLSLALTACGGGPDYSEYRTDNSLLGAEKYDGKEIAVYLFKPEDADARLEVVNTEKEKVIQSFDFPESGDYYAFFEMELALQGAVFQDMNFDGCLDLYIPCCASTANLEGMAWLWNEKSGKFVLSEELCRLYELTVDAEKKTVRGTDYTAPEGPLSTEFEWKDGKLEKTREYTVNN